MRINNAKEAKELEASSRLKIIEETVIHALKIITDEAIQGRAKAEVLCPSCVKEKVVERLAQLDFRYFIRGDDGKYTTITIHW